MAIIEFVGDNSPGGILRYWERRTKAECAREILRCWNRIEELEMRLGEPEPHPLTHNLDPEGEA